MGFRAGLITGGFRGVARFQERALRGAKRVPKAEHLDEPIYVWNVAIGDLILTEVLQGLTDERDFNRARKMLTSLIAVELGGQEIAIQSARNFRALRNLGLTVRKTIHTVIATRCIESRYDLLHNDRDFDPFAKHLALRLLV